MENSIWARQRLDAAVEKMQKANKPANPKLAIYEKELAVQAKNAVYLAHECDIAGIMYSIGDAMVTLEAIKQEGKFEGKRGLPPKPEFKDYADAMSKIEKELIQSIIQEWRNNCVVKKRTWGNPNPDLTEEAKK